MTERKPAGMPYESWVDRQIRAAQERGDFDNLPGAGKPIPGRGQPDDELWWVKSFIRREKLSMALPTSLALRKEAEDVLLTVSTERTEAAVRRIVVALNERIADAVRKPPSGPPLNLAPLDVEAVVATWRERRNRRPHR